MFRFIKQVLIALLNVSGSLASIANATDHIKQISLNDQQSMIQPSLIIRWRIMLLSICSEFR